MKKKMTKAEAREWVSYSCFRYDDTNRAEIFAKLEQIGLTRASGFDTANRVVRVCSNIFYSSFRMSKNWEERAVADLLSIEITEEPDYRDTEQFKGDLKYHAIRFADFILKNAETDMDDSGMFTFKRPNGEVKSSSELYADWLHEHGPQQTLSQILEETRRKQEEILKQKNNLGDPLENLKQMDI